MMDNFRYLSDYYDALVGADYDQIAKYILKKLSDFGREGKYGADLGCGSGTLCYLLEEAGCDMVGIDCSEGMLTRAMSKKEEGSTLLFLHQDITDFSLYGPADFLVSTLDSINYLNSEKEIDSFFASASKNLASGGLLIFDFNTLYKYQKVLSGQNFVYETDGAFCIWENEFDGGTAFYDLTYFVVNNNGSYDRYEESQCQCYFEPELIYKLLKHNGFSLCSQEADYTFSSVKEDTQRIVITAKKE